MEILKWERNEITQNAHLKQQKPGYDKQKKIIKKHHPQEKKNKIK